MINPKDIHISDFNYELPDERIAKYPLAERDSSKLLIYNKGVVSEDHFASLPKYLPQGALMVMNNTRVIRARLHFQKQTGAVIEVFCMEPYFPAEYQQNFVQTGSVEWFCMIGNLKRWKDGVLMREINVKGQTLCLTAERMATGSGNGTNHRVRFAWNDP
ncbi:MAG: S-adenosylmethionine:tRNA ribosyltransferase-isomerase, partial [Bacteroidaceae bacterium]|nr:S-adenosylmethionine:tRNA ribosyltransferase-isomerase [Bacteroidaceae bacterium]